MNMAVAMSAEYNVIEISPEFNRVNKTIRLVLNLTLSPKPSKKEYLLPRGLRKSRKDDKSFEPFDTIQIKTIIKG